MQHANAYSEKACVAIYRLSQGFALTARIPEAFHDVAASEAQRLEIQKAQRLGALPKFVQCNMDMFHAVEACAVRRQAINPKEAHMSDLL